MSEILSVTVENKQLQPRNSALLGALGERLAAEFLTGLGFRLVAANFTCPIGRNTKGVQVTGEIDIIALDGEKLCFIEVKTRRSIEYTGPLSAVDRRKQRQITRTARVYRRIFGLRDMPVRFDVVTVLIERGEEPSIELVKGFWTEAKFRKKAWNGDIY